jgi:hypothetical protein
MITFAFAQLAVSELALDSRRWTSVRIILSSSRLSSLRSASIRASESRYDFDSINLHNDDVARSIIRSFPRDSRKEGRGTRDVQSSQLCLERLTEEDALLVPRPLDVVLCAVDLSLLGVGDGGKVVDEGSD